MGCGVSRESRSRRSILPRAAATAETAILTAAAIRTRATAATEARRPHDVTQPPYDGSLGTCLGASLLSELGKSAPARRARRWPTRPRSRRRSTFATRTSPAASSTAPRPARAAPRAAPRRASRARTADRGCAWWGCWQYDQDPPGAYARNFVSTAQRNGQIPMITYYEILQASGVDRGRARGHASGDERAVHDALLRRLALPPAADRHARSRFLHIEPDFWGYAQQTEQDPHALTAAVATANATDCASEENSIAGMGRCMIAMVAQVRAERARRAPRVGVVDEHGRRRQHERDASTSRARRRRRRRSSSTCGADISDFIVVEASDRDAGYYHVAGQEHVVGRHQRDAPRLPPGLRVGQGARRGREHAARRVAAPASATCRSPNTTNHWKDNRVDYFFAHTQELAATHMVAFAFGAGAGDQTTPETDNGNLDREDEGVRSGAVDRSSVLRFFLPDPRSRVPRRALALSARARRHSISPSSIRSRTRSAASSATTGSCPCSELFDVHPRPPSGSRGTGCSHRCSGSRRTTAGSSRSSSSASSSRCCSS